MKAPIDVTELGIARHQARDRQTRAIVRDPALDALFDSAKGAREVSERLAALAEAVGKDESQTPAGRALKVRQSALQSAQTVAARLDHARQTAQAERERLAKATSAPLIRDAAHAAEIRRALSGMSDKRRGEIIAEAITAGDQDVVAAVLTGPGFLSGLGVEEQESRRHAWRSAHCPAELDRLQRLDKALADHERVVRAFLGYVRKLASDEGPAKLHEAANKAHDSLKEKMA